MLVAMQSRIVFSVKFKYNAVSECDSFHKWSTYDASKCCLRRKVSQMSHFLTVVIFEGWTDATGCQYRAGTYCCHSSVSVLYADQSRNPLFYSMRGSDSIQTALLKSSWLESGREDPPLAASESRFSTVF